MRNCLFFFIKKMTVIHDNSYDSCIDFFMIKLQTSVNDVASE